MKSFIKVPLWFGCHNNVQLCKDHQGLALLESSVLILMRLLILIPIITGMNKRE